MVRNPNSLQSAPAGGSSGRLHYGGRPPLPHQANTRPATYACVEHPELRRLGSGGKGRGNASAGCVVLEAVKRADQMPVAHAAPGGGSQFGTQVRTGRLSHADAPFPIAPDDDLFTHPGLLNQPFLLYGMAARNEVPTLGKRGKQGDVVTLGATGLHELRAHCGGSAPVSIRGRSSPHGFPLPACAGTGFAGMTALIVRRALLFVIVIPAKAGIH